MYKNMYTHKWVLVGIYEYTYMLRKIKDKEGNFWAQCYAFFLFTFFEARRHVCAFSGAEIFEKYMLNLGFTQT
jgi:hypothetical protein